ncbi:Cyclase/dehydrase family protein [Melia azedarach]|uniref:Cyclase/dehydrase family protein n=1 Tax=Melia azedarach TaxID=155640 RepID=A0ACC1Y2I0_MELAZ|nr:Cyclase/dehydrase family protein [Melia azedarach]
MVDETLKRLKALVHKIWEKENGGVHRCVVASITVKAPVCEVWNVLTAYETLPDEENQKKKERETIHMYLYLTSESKSCSQTASNKLLLIEIRQNFLIVPNLAISKIFSRENNKVRILQIKLRTLTGHNMQQAKISWLSGLLLLDLELVKVLMRAKL